MAQVTAIPYANPPRVEVLVQGSSAVRLNIYRLVGDSAPVLVRGAIRLVVTDPLVAVDYEAPVGVPVVYSVQELDALGQPVANVASVPVTIDDEGTWLSQPLYPERVVKIDQLRGSFLEQTFESYGEHVRAEGRDLGVWMGSGRNGVRGGLSFAVQSEADRAVVESMFGVRGERIPPVLCLRSTLAQRLPQPLYVAVPKHSQRGVNWHQGGEATVFDWDVEETSAPSPAIIVPGYTYQDLEAAFSGAILTNLISNPSFGTNTTGWTAAGGTLSRVAAAGASGTGYGRVASTSGATQLSMNCAIPLDGLVGAVSVRVSAKSTNITGAFLHIGVWFLDSAGNVLNPEASARKALTTSWDSWVLENKQIPAGAVSMRIEPIVVTSTGAAYVPTATGRILDVDAALVVISPTAPDYFDGSTAGAEWLGAAHAAQSYLVANTYRGLEQRYQTYVDIERDYSLGGIG